METSAELKGIGSVFVTFCSHRRCLRIVGMGSSVCSFRGVSIHHALCSAPSWNLRHCFRTTFNVVLGGCFDCCFGVAVPASCCCFFARAFHGTDSSKFAHRLGVVYCIFGGLGLYCIFAESEIPRFVKPENNAC